MAIEFEMTKMIRIDWSHVNSEKAQGYLGELTK